MSDQRERVLERAQATGDPDAKAALRRLRCRDGRHNFERWVMRHAVAVWWSKAGVWSAHRKTRAYVNGFMLTWAQERNTPLGSLPRNMPEEVSDCAQFGCFAQATRPIPWHPSVRILRIRIDL